MSRDIRGGSRKLHQAATKIIELLLSLCAVYVQPIISKARADLLRSHFLPTLEKLKKKTVKVVSEEELLKADGRGDTQEAELLILDEFAVLCRDLYAFYPMLIRYVDNNRQALEAPRRRAGSM